MKYVRASLIATALLALAMVIPTSAFAEEGFLPLTAKGFTTEGTKVVINTAGNVPITCSLGMAGAGKFENDKHAKGKIELVKCAVEGLAIDSIGDPEGIILIAVVWLVCLLPETAAKKDLGEFGVALEVEKIPHLEVPLTGATYELLGRAIGAVLTKGKTKNFSVDYTGEKGKQEVQKCKEGLLTKEHTFSVKENGGAAITASLNITAGLMHFEEEVELMDS